MILKPSEKEVTRISSHAKIKGSLVSEGDVLIEGVFEGQIKTTGGVYVLKGAKVISSSVRGESVRVDGLIEGDVKILSALEIGAGGMITGNVECRVLLIEAGGILHGQCDMVNSVTPRPEGLGLLGSDWVKKREKGEVGRGKALGSTATKDEVIQMLMGTGEFVYAQKQKIQKMHN